MKNFDRNDVRILKGIIVKANKLIANIANVTTKIEQIEEEYRRKCEEKKAQLEQDKETMQSELAKFETAVSTLYDCSLEDARDEIYNDGDNVVTDEDADEDVPEAIDEPDDEDVAVVDEDEQIKELDELSENLDKQDEVFPEDEDDMPEDDAFFNDDDTVSDDEDADEPIEDFLSDDTDEQKTIVATNLVNEGWDEETLFAQF